MEQNFRLHWNKNNNPVKRIAIYNYITIKHTDYRRKHMHLVAMVEEVLQNFNYRSYLEGRAAKTVAEKNETIRNMQSAIRDALNNAIGHLQWSTEFKFEENHKDSIDIWGDSENASVIIEIDANRADQVAKKMLSRFHYAKDLGKDVYYVVLCYPGTEKMQTRECQKYVEYGTGILQRLASHQSCVTSVFVDSEFRVSVNH